MKWDKLEKPIRVTESKVSVTTFDKDVYTIEKKLYVECDCGSLGDIARINITRELIRDTKEKDKFRIMDESIDFEFNATNCSDPSYRKDFFNWWDHFTYPFEKVWNRLKGACNLIKGKPVWFYTNLMLNREQTEELIAKLSKSLKDIEDVQVGCNKQS